MAMQSEDGVIVEVFEWKGGAITVAHQHPEVLALWETYASVSDYVLLCNLPETKTMFTRFKPIDL